ncbi:MAG: tRNA glutamyl-Q(34) synthetase GluQRS [Planctomycetes bacterium]|nr:tRNA glutamyl-Q(34) synthetase GluQRS [Planctomycetota bacterium]
MPESITRLAPSPTGALHLGNARTFLVNWLLARRYGWRVLMRVEDLDGPRVKKGSDRKMLDELAWLGLTWETPVVYQSQRAEFYRSALESLIKSGWAYPCVCSRKDIRQAGGAPHEDDAAEAYPGTCRGRFRDASDAAATGRPVAWRVRVTNEPIAVADRFASVKTYNLAKTCGDFVIFKTDGLAAYQLAVVVDDSQAGVDAIVRGDDLLESAARQIHLRRLLGLSPQPAHWHLPLVVGPDGKRLAKRHGDTRLEYYRSRGVSPERILGLLAFWSGIIDRRRDASIGELSAVFDISKVPRERIIFTRQDDQFLCGG